MSSAQLNEHSVFEHRKLADIYEEVRRVYRQYPQPWVIGYSGGKDSTAVLQIVWTALSKLPPEERQKPVFVIASDTKVETPVIVDFIDDTLRRIGETAAAAGMPFQTEKVMPTLNDSFWVNLIGRGYPAPTARFRWCTERMKIDPANRFIEEKVTQYGEVIMVLGVRKAESSTRMQLMSTYEVKDHILRRHSMLQGAYVYAPVAEFSTQDIWDYLLNVPSPWGGDNRKLITLYRNANAGECPLVIDTTTPSCGNSRFGCWVCTVAMKDNSMEALIENGEEWLEPLFEVRQWLAETVDPAKKRQYRDIRGRDGRAVLNRKTGELAARTYTLEASKLALEKVLRAQKAVRENAPGKHGSMTLISDEELHEIRRIWRTERQDWDDSVPAIYRRVYGADLDWNIDDNGLFDSGQKGLLSSLCREHEVPFELVAKLLEKERQFSGMARRAGIQDELAKVLAEEWRRDEAAIAADLRLDLSFEDVDAPA
jgi:DNA sulfur modification protein DndC